MQYLYCAERQKHAVSWKECLMCVGQMCPSEFESPEIKLGTARDEEDFPFILYQKAVMWEAEVKG